MEVASVMASLMVEMVTIPTVLLLFLLVVG